MGIMLATARADMERARQTAESDCGVALTAAESRYERALTSAAAARLTTERAAKAARDTTLARLDSDYAGKCSRYASLERMPADDLRTMYLRYHWNVVHPVNTHALHDAEWMLAACREVARSRMVRLPALPEYAT